MQTSEENVKIGFLSKIVGKFELEFKPDEVTIVGLNEDGTHEYGLPYETYKKLYSTIDEIEQEAIAGLPVGEFISTKEARIICEKSFRKLNICSERLLMIRKIGKVRFFYKPSLLQYLETGDGRIYIGKSVDIH